MKFKQSIYILIFAVAIFMSSCGEDRNYTGREYMPDMAHSIAYEANVLNGYHWNTWEAASTGPNGSGKSVVELSQPRLPVAGTMPRGYAGVHYANSASDRMHAMEALQGKGSNRGISVPMNGTVPFYYEDTEEDRTRATLEMTKNPFAITDQALAEGKELYDIYCGICHGKKIDGNGYLVRDENPAKGDPGGAYPAQPISFLTDSLINLSDGRYYFAIMYGKNMMGGYADKLSYEERWNVIHHIRALQAKEKKLTYNSQLNTLNNAAIPAASMPKIAMDEAHGPEEEEAHGAHDEHGEGSHDHDGDHDHDHDHDHH